MHDPVGGLADLAAHRVRFVGEPARRIAEDVLRVLRYYRFEARFGNGEGDAAAREACREAVTLLPTLSAERVAQEVLRLLSVADPMPALRMMREDEVLAAILPEATRLDRLDRLIAVENSLISGDAPTPDTPTPPSPASGGGGTEPAAPDFSFSASRGGIIGPVASTVPSPASGGGLGWGRSGLEPADPSAAPDPLRRLAALVDVDPAGAALLAGRLHLSNSMRDRLAGLAPPWPLDPAGEQERTAAGAVPARGRPRSRSGAASGRRGAPRPGKTG